MEPKSRHSRRRRRSGDISFHIEDIETSVYDHIVDVSHWWPGITPLTVWDLPYDMWLLYVRACKDARDALKEGNPGYG